jgi:dihydrodipicolinate synthase/N-acetylneuraminate lyase
VRQPKAAEKAPLELHRRVLSLLALGAYGEPPIGAIKLAMKTPGIPIFPAVRGPALHTTDERATEAVLKATGLLETS